jgi:hypothetical protein
MKASETMEKAKAGMFIVYNDGRPGHVNVRAQIISRDARGMVVQFDDRADTTNILFSAKAWMDFITLV